jgi:hypothetical protein
MSAYDPTGDDYIYLITLSHNLMMRYRYYNQDTENEAEHQKLFEDISANIRPITHRHIVHSISLMADPLFTEYLIKKMKYKRIPACIEQLQEVIQWRYNMVLYQKSIHTWHNISRKDHKKFLISIFDIYGDMFGVSYNRNPFNCPCCGEVTLPDKCADPPSDKILTDPTCKLYMCLEMSKHVGIAVIPEIDRCIAQGAKLTEQNNFHIRLYEAIPVLMAMQLGCDPRIVEHLKNAWWDDSYKHCQYISHVRGISSNQYRSIDEFIRWLEIDTWIKPNRYLLKEYARIFCVSNDLIDVRYE